MEFIIPDNWKLLFTEAKEELEELQNFLSDKSFYPKKKDIFRAFELINPEDVKVVIIGQDPYPSKIKTGEPKATGLAFSIRDDDHDIPISLKNIFIELSENYEDFKFPKNGNLEKWCTEGVMLLNKGLTVAPGKPNSHVRVWKGFLKRTIEHIKKKNPKCIFVLWGRQAEEICEDYLSGFPVLITSHPSGFSFSKGFHGSQHFLKINELLIKQNKTTINWNLS